ncbi:MAG TPA: 1-deoxy-D-xylulose-5-phosphate reductoisomerase [Limnochordales bacterium]
MKPKQIAIVGATGSIGRQALDVVRHHPHALRVVALAGGRRVEPMLAQVTESVSHVVMEQPEAAQDLREALVARGRGDVTVAAGPDALVELVTRPDVDLVVMAMVGARALVPTLAALEAGKDVALATKEVLVAGGPLVMDTAKRSRARLLPVDSEHSAIFQCLQGEAPEAVARLILTASGGPFRDTPLEELQRVTPEQALRHPTWRMGAKVTIDSATLMNKGLEVIEAHWLFGVPLERIDVVVHPQSIVHSCVELVDGSILAHLGPTDMRIPIQYALLYPERAPSPVRGLSLAEVGSLTFHAPDRTRFPALDLAYAAARIGGTMPAVLNAANEVAVELFLQGRIGFTDIPRLVEAVMDDHEPEEAELTAILEADGWARRVAHTAGAALTL